MNQNAPEKVAASISRGWRTAALILASALVILLGLFSFMVVSGWRFHRLDRSVAGEATASAEKWSPPVPGEDAASRVKRLARDVSALSIAPTNRPDPSKVLDEARALVAKGEYEEALQRHIWYHNHALEYDSGQTGVRLSFALSSWIELGRKFPKAKQALVEIRDRGNRAFADGRGDFALFMEVSAINKSLQAEDDTVALFKDLLERDPDLARQCYFVAEGLLVRKGQYEICLGLIPDFGARFDSIRKERELRAKMFGMNSPMRPELQKFQDDRFVTQTRDLVEILVAGGRKPEAEKIRDQSLAIMDDPRLASAVLDAENKLAK